MSCNAFSASEAGHKSQHNYSAFIDTERLTVQNSACSGTSVKIYGSSIWQSHCSRLQICLIPIPVPTVGLE